MAQWKFEDWLLFWLLDNKSFEFDWDKGNTTKNLTKHSVTLAESESVFRIGLALPLGVEIASMAKYKEERFGIISARSANKNERIKYEKNIRQIFKNIQ